MGVNARLRARKIRVISVSLGVNARQDGYEEVKAAIARTDAADIYPVFLGSEGFMGLGKEPAGRP